MNCESVMGHNFPTYSVRVLDPFSVFSQATQVTMMHSLCLCMTVGV